jgi:hypothetical protein
MGDAIAGEVVEQRVVVAVRDIVVALQADDLAEPASSTRRSW